MATGCRNCRESRRSRPGAWRASVLTLNTRIGREMFFTRWWPASIRRTPTSWRTCSRTACEMATSPGTASASSRAATLTPSPAISPPSIRMSPRLMPMRNSMRESAARSRLRSAMARWISTAQDRASTALANSTRMSSPLLRTMRPWWRSIAGSVTLARTSRSCKWVPASSRSIIRL
jgi:hypothetical protein